MNYWWVKCGEKSILDLSLTCYHSIEASPKGILYKVLLRFDEDKRGCVDINNNTTWLNIRVDAQFVRYF